jgi:hypothetical protein
MEEEDVKETHAKGGVGEGRENNIKSSISVPSNYLL